MSKCSLCVVPAGIIIIQKDIPIVAVCFDQLEFFRKESAGILVYIIYDDNFAKNIPGQMATLFEK